MKERIPSFILAFYMVIASLSCKKNDAVDGFLTPATGTRTELTLDSIYLYAKEIYLWNDALPSYHTFSPRSKYGNVSPERYALESALSELSKYKINKDNGIPYEYTYRGKPKYSFLEDGIEKKRFNTHLPASRQQQYAGSFITNHFDKISYLAIHTFPPLIDVKEVFDEVFSEIADKKPETLVLDLRYNAGGYIETAEHLANLMAPEALNGKIMYVESFNSTLRSRNIKMLKNQPYLDEKGDQVYLNGRLATMADVDFSEVGNTHYFKKTGRLKSIERLYVITSDLTASASELLISVLKPYIDVKLVGEKTFGKPVGAFPITIDNYDVYLVSFLLKNSQGWFDYFDGMNPDIPVLLTADPMLGDVEEPAFKSILVDFTAKFKKSYRLSDFPRTPPRVRPLTIRNDINPVVKGVENRLHLQQTMDE